MTSLIRIITLLCLLSVGTTASWSQEELFPRPAELEPDINFWVSIFTEYSSDQGVLHDNRYLGVVYEQVPMPASTGRRTRQREVQVRRKRYQGILGKLAGGKHDNLTAEEQRVLALWPADVSTATLKGAVDRIRYQQGLSDRFREGAIRSGRWRDYIKAELAKHGVPKELVALPHVESSYNPDARSHVGASGIWQFTRSTGRRYMQVDHVLDERNDPFSATGAAAKLLAYNYSIAGNWPMAITAYNHGLAGVRRAMRKHGDTAYAEILREYRGRTFGFASRNFYVAFLAASQVDRNIEQYFPGIVQDVPVDYQQYRLPDYMPAADVAEVLGVGEGLLAQHNPAVQATIWQGSKYLPRDFEVRLPAGMLHQPMPELMAGVPADRRFSKQLPDMFHTIARGDTLSEIADRYDTTVNTLVALNGLGSRHRIRAGQQLRLPAAGPAPAVVASAMPEPASAAATSTSSQPAPAAVATPAVAPVALASTTPQPEPLVAASTDAEPEPIVAASTAAEPEPLVIASSGSEPESLVIASSGSEPAPLVIPTGRLEPAPPKAAAEEAPALPTITAADLVSAGALDDEQISGGALADAAVSELGPADDATAIEAETIQASLLSDPSDYDVAEDLSIEVHPQETLGHFADWLGIRTQRLRDINGLAFRTPVAVGQRIKLDFGNVDIAGFEKLRGEYHRQKQDTFFRNHTITGVTEHVVARGESVWILSLRRYDVPVWLFRQYNPELDLNRVRPGTRLSFPVLTANESS